MSEPRAGLMVTSNVRLVRPLGEGGMGSVWLADHLSLRTNVVVKFLAKELVDSPDAIARFSREAAAASQVKSPHVVQTLDHGFLDGGAPYIVMELLEGKNLEHRIDEGGGRLPPREVITVVLQLARALGKAHERGIVHRDIKPSNVFLLDAGGGEVFVKLLDFGIAKGNSLGVQGSTTRSGTFVGSPFYMSPEQIVGARDVDFRSDLWSLGVVAFEALVGRKPFVAETLGALALKIHRDSMPVPTALAPDLPAAVDAWFAKACAREPAERFATAREMAESLAAALLGEEAVPPLSAKEGGLRSREPPPRPPESHALAATLRSEATGADEPAGPGRPRAVVLGAAALSLGVVGLVVAVLVGRLDVARGEGKEARAREARVQAATLAEEAAASPDDGKPQPDDESSARSPPAAPPPALSLAPVPVPLPSVSSSSSLARTHAAVLPSGRHASVGPKGLAPGSASAASSDDDIK